MFVKEKPRSATENVLQQKHLTHLVKKVKGSPVLSPMKVYVEAMLDKPIRKVVAYEMVHRLDGYCETCVINVIEVDIYYRNQHGVLEKYAYRGTLPELIAALP